VEWLAGVAQPPCIKSRNHRGKGCKYRNRKCRRMPRVDVTQLFSLRENAIVKEPGLSLHKELPPRQGPACFNVGAPVEQLTAPQGPGE